MGIAVDVVTVVRVGAGTGVVPLGTAGVVSARLVVVAVATNSADVVMVVDGTSDVVARLDTVIGPRVVDMLVTVGGLVAMLTLVVTGLKVDLSVTLGVTLVVTGILGVVLRVVVRVMVVDAVVGVALAVETSLVVTFSGKVVGLRVAEVEEDQDGGGVVVDLVDTSTLPVTGWVVSVIGCMMTGLSVVTTCGGALVEAVVARVSGAPGTGGGVTSFLVVVAAIPAVEILGDVVVVAVVTVAAAEVAEVRKGFVVVTGR